MIKVDCKAYADEIMNEVKEAHPNGILTVISCGDDPMALSYVRGKEKDCERCGIQFKHSLAKSMNELEDSIEELNCDDAVFGIVVAFPFGKVDKMDEVEDVLDGISGYKDIDGMGIWTRFETCTVDAIMHIIHKNEQYFHSDYKTALVIGKGRVGWPVFQALLEEGYTVTLAHSQSDINTLIQREYNVIVSAAGVPKLFSIEDTCADLIVDAGTTFVDGKLVGDVDTSKDLEYDTQRVTTVPGGVGLVTRAMCMKHFKEACEEWQ